MCLELGDSVSKLLSLSHTVKIEGGVRRKISELLLSLRGMTAPARVAGMIALIQLIAEADFSVSAGNDHRLNRMEQRLERIRIFCSCNFSREIKLDDAAAHRIYATPHCAQSYGMSCQEEVFRSGRHVLNQSSAMRLQSVQTHSPVSTSIVEWAIPEFAAIFFISPTTLSSFSVEAITT